jgi:hypothetical protein
MFLPFAFDVLSRTYLARFRDTLTDEDLTACDVAVRTCHSRHGAMAGLQDFSGVGEIEISSSQLLSHASRLSVMTGQQRVIVADGMLFGMMRMFATHQSQHSLEPIVLRTLPEAYKLLGIAFADFHPVALATAAEEIAGTALARGLRALYPLDCASSH